MAFIYMIFENENTNSRMAATQALYSYILDEEKDVEHNFDVIKSHFKQENISIKQNYVSKILDFSLQENTEIESIISKYCNKTDLKSIPILIQSILKCALAEILSPEIDKDSKIIISEYLKITESFFDKNEVRFVNAILDNFVKDTQGK